MIKDNLNVWHLAYALTMRVREMRLTLMAANLDPKP
jgi:hypothetical protein